MTVLAFDPAAIGVHPSAITTDDELFWQIGGDGRHRAVPRVMAVDLKVFGHGKCGSLSYEVRWKPERRFMSLVYALKKFGPDVLPDRHSKVGNTQKNFEECFDRKAPIEGDTGLYDRLIRHHRLSLDAAAGPEVLNKVTTTSSLSLSLLRVGAEAG